MFILDGLPVHRLPVWFALPEHWTPATTRAALVAALTASPSLCSRFVFEDGRFEQVHVGLDPDSVDLPEVDWAAPVDEFCRSSRLRVVLSSGPPWAAAIVHAADGRFLCVEFHHIAVDGPGITVFEQLLFDDTMAPLATTEPERVSALYDRVAELEDSAAALAATPHPAPEPSATASRSAGAAGPPRRRGIGTRADRSRSVLRADDAGFVAASARSLGVTQRAVYQAAFEEALATAALHPTYASASSWRWSLGAVRVVACLPVLIRCRVGAESVLPARARRVFAESMDPRLGTIDVVDLRPEVVFSYEALGLHRGRYVPADDLPRFDVYARIDVADVTTIEIETDPDRVPSDLATHLLDQMVGTLLTKEQR
jgi:hypothetical protein